MRRFRLPIFCLYGVLTLSACSADRPDSSGHPKFLSEETTILSRHVAVPVTLVTPTVSDGEPFPLVIMAHGHGGSREEGGGYRLAAEAMAKHGIASIRMDFPGCGDSTESFTENNLSNMLLDLQAARDFAGSREEIDDDRVGLLGYSMGGRLVALLAAIDTGYKVMVTWTPAVADVAEGQVNSLGGPDVYYVLKERARETGMAEYTTRWGTTLQLGYQWFTDLEESMPLESLGSFKGPILVLYGDQDDDVPPSISEAAIVAATNSSDVVRHVVVGAGHALGFYSNRPKIATEVVNTTVEFFSRHL